MSSRVSGRTGWSSYLCCFARLYHPARLGCSVINKRQDKLHGQAGFGRNSMMRPRAAHQEPVVMAKVVAVAAVATRQPSMRARNVINEGTLLIVRDGRNRSRLRSSLPTSQRFGCALPGNEAVRNELVILRKPSSRGKRGVTESTRSMK